MATDFSRNVLRVAIAQMCQNLGWNSVQSTAMEILTDVLERYMCEIGRFSCRYAEQFGRTDANLDDLGLAIQEMGINLNEVEDYIKHVDPVPFAIDVPAFPVHMPNHLNFPKPNSRELREREDHVPPHLPPLNSGWNEEVYTPRAPSAASATSGPPQGSPKQGAPLVLSQGGSAEKRAFSSPVDGVSPVKKPRVLPDDVLHSHYEMKGVVMTTSGFLSPVKGQGKMPDARAPPKMPLYPAPSPTVMESGTSGSEVRMPVESGGDSGNRQKVTPVTGVVPSPKVKKNLSSFPKHIMKGTKSPRSPARAKSPGRSKSPKRGADEGSREDGSKLKELLITGDSALDLTMRPAECRSKGEEYGEIPSSPEHDLVIADDEDPEVKQRRLTSYCDTINLVVRASREAVQKEEDEERHLGKGAETMVRERQIVMERLEKEKMEWFREQEQQIKQDIEVALQAKKQLEMERQQREHAQISEKEREAHIDDTINDVIANATAEIAQIEDEESRREKDVYEFDDEDFAAVVRPSVALHPKLNEKEPAKDLAKDTKKDVTSEKVKDVTKDVSVSKDAKKSKSKKLKIKISSEAGIVKEPGLNDDVVDIKEKLKQKLQMRGSSPEPPGGHMEDVPTFAISARPTVITKSPNRTSSPSRIPAVSSPSATADSAVPSGADSGKDVFVAVPSIRIEKTTLTIKKGDRGREGHEHKKSKKKNKDKAKKHEKNKERREKEHSAGREERRKEKKRKKEERKKEKKSHQEEGKSLLIPKLTFKFGSGSGSSSISVCRSDTPKAAPPAEPVKLVIRPPVAPPTADLDVKPVPKVASPPPSPKSPVPVLPSPQPSPPPSLPPSPVHKRSPSPPPPRRTPTPTLVFTPSPARSATPTFIPSLPDSPSPTRSPEHIILRSPSRSISPEPLSHSPVPTPSPSPPPCSPTPPQRSPTPPPSPPPPPRATPSSPPRRRSPSPPPPAKPSPAPSPPKHISPHPPSDSPKPILLSRPTLAARKAIPPSQRKKQAKGKRTASASQVAPASPLPPLPPTSAALAFQRGVISETQGTIRDEHGETIWICPTCKLADDGSPMIGCDDCPDWYHWLCVGIKVEPAETENWYCPRCKLKQKKKKQRRKKSK